MRRTANRPTAVVALLVGCVSAGVLLACLVFVLFGAGLQSGILQLNLGVAAPTPTLLDALIPALATQVDTRLLTPAVSSPLPIQTLQLPTFIRPSLASVPQLCADPQPALVLDRQVRSPAKRAEPAPRTPFRDPVFGTCIVRVSDRKNDVTAGDDSVGLKNEYSRVQAFNADGTRLIARGTALTWYLYDASTLQPIGELPLEFDPRWDATNPDVIYYAAWATDSNPPRLMSYNIRTKSAAVVHDFGTDFPGQRLGAVWTRYEGSPSLDGRYWGFQVEDADWHRIALILYDQKENRVVAKRDLRGVAGADDIDSTHVSPLGDYVVAEFGDHACEPGQLGTVASPCGVMVYDPTFKTGRSVLRTMGHSDFALNAQGNEVLVFQDLDADNISMVELGTGKVTPLLPIDFSHTALGMHISGRAFRRPGWAVVGIYNGGKPNSLTWMDDVIMAVELKSGGRIVRLAHHQSLYNENEEHDYWAEPHASSNPDLTRIVFTTNWGRTGTAEVEMYMMQLPADWTSRLP